ncbi:MAG: hypothetical protein KME27_31440 [Lyngbya sp. HA4199-MV5]|jgi:hypothetical protein|nr:hypothetical protein [Lyngbya sp. HA4199-MV5]
MFEALVYTVVTLAVLTFYGCKEATIATAPIVASVPQPVVTTDYAAMSIAELKALGKQHNIPGWKAWKHPQTAIAKLEALAA